MDRAQLPLNALRAFEAAARHLNITRAAQELCVSQGAVSHQITALEQKLGVMLFRRQSRGLLLTDEGRALVPVLSDMFDRIGSMLDLYTDGKLRSVITISVVGSFAIGWLFDRLDDFTQKYPHIDVRIQTNNNVPDLIGDGLDFAIRFGDGAWHSTHSEKIMDAPLTPLCAPATASRLSAPDALLGESLLRSYRADEWPRWFTAAQLTPPPIKGPIFDNSALMVAAAIAGHGIALAPAILFEKELRTGRLVQPFALEVDCGSYWLTRAMNRNDNEAMHCFRSWLTQETATICGAD